MISSKSKLNGKISSFFKLEPNAHLVLVISSLQLATIEDRTLLAYQLQSLHHVPLQQPATEYIIKTISRKTSMISNFGSLTTFLDDL